VEISGATIVIAISAICKVGNVGIVIFGSETLQTPKSFDVKMGWYI
jgi:hypothetical protein